MVLTPNTCVVSPDRQLPDPPSLALLHEVLQYRPNRRVPSSLPSTYIISAHPSLLLPCLSRIPILILGESLIRPLLPPYFQPSLALTEPCTPAPPHR